MSAEIIPVALHDRAYEIWIERGMLPQFESQLAGLELGPACAVLSDGNVGPRYGKMVCDALSRAGYEAYLLEIDPGEESKTLRQVEDILAALVQCQLDRGSFLVAVGGGVVGDVGGLVAALYMRGIDCIHVATSLMAQVDAMIGGKTGVNLPGGKNLVGAFHQPRRVIIDPLTLGTLPQHELRSGFAEVVKYGVIEDPSLFRFVEENLGPVFALKERAIDRILTACCRIKAQVVAEDERESGRRAILNFGHTLGHAIEAVTGYVELTHGEAVAIGMAAAARLSVRLGYLDSQQADRIGAVLEHAGLPTELAPYPAEAVLEVMRRDKKVREGKLRFVLVEELGKVFVTTHVREEDVLALWE